MSTGPRAIVIASFVSVTLGFVAGYGLAPRVGGSMPAASDAAPHAVGPGEFAQLGMQALEAGDFGSAERYFRRVVDLAPDQAGPHADLAVALMYQERWEEAHGQLEVAERIEPGTPEVYFLQGVVYRDGMRDSTRARASWERFLAMVPPESPQAATVQTWLDGLGGGGEVTP